MPWYPTFKLYQSNGSTLVYWLEFIQNIQGWPEDKPANITIENLRSQGSINIPGGKKSYDIVMNGFLKGLDYTDVEAQMKTLRDTILSNTPYVLKLDESISSTDDINVIRVEPIKFEDSFRLKLVKYTIIFKALSW